MTSEQIAQNVRIIWAKYIGLQNNISDEEIKQFASTIEAIETESCEDCIRRKDAISTVNHIYNSCRECTLEEYRDTLIESFNVLCGVHSARNSGKWLKGENGIYKCSKCCFGFTEQPVTEMPNGEEIPAFDYCPVCGAKMEVQE